MKNISEDIKKNDFKSVYLIYGEEEYLKKQYRDNLKKAIAGDDTMNCTYFDSESSNVKEILSVCETLPFFAEKRLVIIEDSGLLKSSNEELADYIKKIPDYLIMVFVEKEIDKRNKVYKAIDSVGYTCEMKPQTVAVLQKWIVGMLSKEKLAITKDACDRLLDMTGAGMDYIKQELEKLICYCQGRDAVTIQDVEAVCAEQTTGKIFDMMAAIGSKNQQLALNLYYDLLTLKEPPMRILYMMVRQFNGIYQAKELSLSGVESRQISTVMGVAPFVASKYLAQAKNFSIDSIKEALKDAADTEERVKQGRLSDKLGVEMLIVKYSA